MIGDLLSELYPWTLAIHVMAVIAWMAGLFYLPRLFVYHAEKAAENQELSLIYQEMERKLYKVIMQPAMVTTWVFGLALAFTPGIVDWSSAWPWIKAASVILMTGFHHALGSWVKVFERGENTRPGRFYRMANEAPTVLMVVIVVMVIVRPF